MPRAARTARKGGSSDRADARRAYDASRGSAGERLYTATWARAAKDFLTEPDNALCCHCGALDPPRLRPATVVNHRVPHRGDHALFWDRGNWEGVCKPCHDGPIQRAEFRNGYRRRGG